MKKNSSKNLWLLSITSGILLSIPFILPHCGLVSLFALVPLFAAEYIASENKVRHFWIYYYSCFLLWNVISTWWIWYATPPGAVAAIILNALQMAIIFRIFRFLKTKKNTLGAYIAFAAIWCWWEHCYQTWQVTWPWLTLGNSFAQSIKHIQWYEVTGSIAGSLWIILANILVFTTIRSASLGKQYSRWAIAALTLIIVPSTISHIRYAQLGKTIADYQETDAKEVVILQPNIDPYADKFAGKTQVQQDSILLKLANENTSDKTFLVLAPETFFNPSAIAGSIIENRPENPTLDTIMSFASSHKVNFIFGAITQKYYPKATNKPTRSAREDMVGIWWDVFNTAVFTDKNKQIDFYHKSKLVILAETIPYIGDKSVLSNLGIDLGGGFGNFGVQQSRSIFNTEENISIGTAVCYESVFGNFFREYIKAGANLMTIITNDGWWKNTAGHIQHLHYASLRAIETRRDIARSANTGISAIINKRGDIISPTQWWKECAIIGNVYPSEHITPFVRYGDLIGKNCSIVALALILVLLVSKRKNYA